MMISFRSISRSALVWIKLVVQQDVSQDRTAFIKKFVRQVQGWQKPNHMTLSGIDQKISV
jgi:hypothetical protein